MAGGKQTPRQRMIGILYLVLLGLIALNVPDSLLDAFKNITHSLDQSSNNVTTGIQSTYQTFEQTKLKEQHERAQPIYDRAKKASAKCRIQARILADHSPRGSPCTLQTTHHFLRWNPPSLGFIKINFDGSRSSQQAIERFIIHTQE